MIAPSPYYVQPPGLRLSDDLGLNEKQERELRDFAWSRLIVGMTEADGFLDWAVKEFPRRKKKVLEAAFNQVLQARRDQQASWPAEVRTTALNRAFAELSELGILAKPNFSCCGNCANHEIWDERDDTRTWRGYVYFHAQDAERIPEDRETYLGYGVFLDAVLPEAEWEALSDEAKDQTYTRLVRELMSEATAVIESHGIEVAWDQDLGVRILLRNVDWYAEV